MKANESGCGERIPAVLLDNHIHFLNGEIAADNVNETIKWIVFENLNKKPKTLTLYVNSEGGDLYQSFALIDIMNNSTHPIRTIGLGNIMSAAFLIFAAGTKGERYIAPNTGIMCHQFTGASENKYHDLKAQMAENELCNQRMVDILVTASGKSSEFVEKFMLPASDVYLTAEQTISYGVADKLFEKIG